LARISRLFLAARKNNQSLKLGLVDFVLAGKLPCGHSEGPPDFHVRGGHDRRHGKGATRLRQTGSVAASVAAAPTAGGGALARQAALSAKPHAQPGAQELPDGLRFRHGRGHRAEWTAGRETGRLPEALKVSDRPLRVRHSYLRTGRARSLPAEQV